MRSILILAKPYEAELVRKACADLGHEALVPEEGVEPAEAVERQRPDLLVLSTRLGRGAAEPSRLLAMIRSSRHGDGVPVVLLADEGEPELEVNRVLLRPYSAEALVTCVRELVSNGAPVRQSVAYQRIEAIHELVQEGDYFSLLEVSPRATTEEIEQAHRRLAAELDPERVDPDLAVEYGQQLAEIREVLDEARQVLGIDALREAYRAQLEETK